jgi:hypothetical protein
MRAFQISLNGKKVCLVGIGDDGVLSTTITYVPFRKRRETRLYVGGLVMPQNEHVRWKEARLRVGDEVRLKVVEAEAVDAPSVRHPPDPVAEAKAEKRYVRKMAKKLGWKVQVTRRSQ